MVRSLRPITKKILDVHLMISPVMEYIEEFIKAGSDIISFHPDADHNTDKIISFIKKSNCKVGIAIHPNIKIQTIKKYLKDIDLVIVMTVIPGFSGQKFLQEQFTSRIQERFIFLRFVFSNSTISFSYKKHVF